MAAVAGIHAATATLGAATEDVVTMSGPSRAPAEIIHHGDVTDAIYFRLDGVAAVSAADENQVLLANERLFIKLPSNNEISVISAGACTYSVVLLNT